MDLVYKGCVCLRETETGREVWRDGWISRSGREWVREAVADFSPVAVAALKEIVFLQLMNLPTLGINISIPKAGS